MLVDNEWVVTGAMFFLFANAFFVMSKSTKVADKIAEESKQTIMDNKITIEKLTKEIVDFKEHISKLDAEIIDLKEGI